MKRLLDIIASFCGLLIVSVFLFFVTVGIRLNSPGPVFYRQSRVGRYKREFTLIKFRTMRVEADKTGPQITKGGDDRITGTGRFLRRTKLDELPELWNVLKGDMSLVGPRPEVPKYMVYYRDEWRKVLTVRPGITDYATLQFRDEESVLRNASDVEKAYVEVVLPIKLKLSMQYVENRSFWLDLKIILLTVWGITLGRFFAKPDNVFALQAIEQIRTNKI